MASKNSQKRIMQTGHEERKTYSYDLEGVHISFNLRIDVKKELIAAKEILQRAIKDFDKDLEKLK